MASKSHSPSRSRSSSSSAAESHKSKGGKSSQLGTKSNNHSKLGSHSKSRSPVKGRGSKSHSRSPPKRRSRSPLKRRSGSPNKSAGKGGNNRSQSSESASSRSESSSSEHSEKGVFHLQLVFKRKFKITINQCAGNLCFWTWYKKNLNLAIFKCTVCLLFGPRIFIENRILIVILGVVTKFNLFIFKFSHFMVCILFLSSVVEQK